MKHSQIICTQINQADPGLPDKKTHFTSSIDGVSVRVNSDDWDRLSVSLVDLEVNVTNPQTPEDEEAFMKRCNRLSERIGYLEESLKAVEVDETGKIGIIRSDPPVVEENTISYFEIEVNGKTGRISLARVVQDNESGQDRPGRIVLGYHLLSRLIDDLSASASDMFIRQV